MIRTIVGGDRTSASLEKFKLERQNPLPPGRYWQDIFPKQFDAFDGWLAKNRDHLDLLADEWFVEGADKPGTRGEVKGNPLLVPERRWILFRVIEPVKWEGPGLATIATDDIRASTNTEPVIDPANFPDFGDTGFGKRVGEGLQQAAFGFGALVAAGLIINALISKLTGRG